MKKGNGFAAAGVLLLFLSGAIPAARIDPARYPDVIDTAGDFKLRVNRQYKTVFELELIVKSEESDAVRKFNARLREKDRKRNLSLMKEGRQPISRPEHPALVNEKMPVYFLDLIKRFQQGDFSPAAPLTMTSASFHYSASVRSGATWTLIANRKKKVLKNVVVVNMELTWKHRCGAECGLDYSEKRTVVFNAKGKLLDIETQSESAPAFAPIP